jgi:hypothetical protein
MRKSVRRRGRTIVRASTFLALAGVATVALTCTPDSPRLSEATQRQLRRQVLEARNVTVLAPTLVVVAPLDTPDTLAVRNTGCAVAAAHRMQCAQLVAGAHVVDPQYSAVFLVPKDVPIGYVLAAPRVRPLTIHGAVARAELEDSVRAFEAVIRRVGANR